MEILKSIDPPSLGSLSLERGLLIGLILLAGVICYGVGRTLPAVIQLLFRLFTAPQISEGAQTIMEPHQGLFGVVTALAAAEVAILIIPKNGWLSSSEVAVSLLLAIVTSWLASRLLRQFFDVYLLDIAFESGRKLNSELLVVGKFLANTVIVLLAVILFAQTHELNIFGIFASLGIGGLAVAFAAQKTLEQVLGGVVILIDRPFTVDDYVGLPDGTFGRVEAVGLRSTKIRTSGKGTLMVVPNSALTQANIENFSGAQKVMSILYLTIHRQISAQEQALIRQVIHQSTDDIFGIDPRSTDIKFREQGNGDDDFGMQLTHVQCTFFILGSGSGAMDLRRQLLDVASQRLRQRLLEYDINFDIEDPTIYVNSPITV
ncbi:MAG: mechanosensitive ion channel [Synechococcaceae cyanobacterium SM2_3_1]|nr:mechanosensitive ion channel [Synechococcaceae cyanobacterium SM2_3_1]